jgi:hypothetical protein
MLSQFLIAFCGEGILPAPAGRLEARTTITYNNVA